MPEKDDPQSIAEGYGELIKHFAAFYQNQKFDYVFALGDRFEMAAAVNAGIPMGLRFVHLHGGETTLGAIDNIYRHQISLASALHFTASETFSERVAALVESKEAVYTVGALSLDGIESIDIPKWASVRINYHIPKAPFILATFHPETVAVDRNNEYAKIAAGVLGELSEKFIVVITQANADTLGSHYRKAFKMIQSKHHDRIFLVENFGRTNYFSAMKHCAFLFGNTSSGIIEAASFHKYVVNVGGRQKGRLQSANIINVPFQKEEMIAAAHLASQKGKFRGENVYHKEGTADRIIEVLVDV